MWVFIDESGDTGFKFEANSSTHFVLTAVVFPDAAEAERCREDIRAFKRALRLPSRELKFNQSELAVRKAFFRAVAGRTFRVFSITIDKTAVDPRQFKPPEKLYHHAVRLLMAELLPDLTDARICFDRCGSKSFRSSLRKTAKESFVGTLWPIRHWTDLESGQDVLLQAADMFCGGIARDESGGKDGSQLRSLIRPFEASSSVWPASPDHLTDRVG